MKGKGSTEVSYATNVLLLAGVVGREEGEEELPLTTLHTSLPSGKVSELGRWVTDTACRVLLRAIYLQAFSPTPTPPAILSTPTPAF